MRVTVNAKIRRWGKEKKRTERDREKKKKKKKKKNVSELSLSVLANIHVGSGVRQFLKGRKRKEEEK